MNRTTALLVFVGILTLASPLSAQDTSTPEASTAAAMEFMRNSDWSGMAELMHPDALTELHDLFLPILQHPNMEEFRVEIFGLSTPEDAAELSGSDLFQKIVDLTMSSEPDLADVMSTATIDVIGHVMEGATAHVVYRMNMTVEEISISQMAVSSLREVDGRWLALLTADLRGMIVGMQQMLNEQ